MDNSLGRATRKNSERRHVLKRGTGLGRSVLTLKRGQGIIQAMRHTQAGNRGGWMSPIFVVCKSC